MSLTRRLGAEALGTGLLIISVVGSGIMATKLTDDVAVQLLANAGATVGALIALILMFGPISGAHFNPVVTAAT
ncbi:MAG: Propanediol diffusion facilitator, partial [Actinomycetota bacterium]